MPNKGGWRKGAGSNDDVMNALGKAILASMFGGGNGHSLNSTNAGGSDQRRQQKQRDRGGGGGGAARGDGATGGGLKPAEWVCPCGANPNRAWRTACYKCGAPRVAAAAARNNLKTPTTRPTTTAAAATATTATTTPPKQPAKTTRTAPTTLPPVDATQDPPAEEDPIVLDQKVTDEFDRVIKKISCQSKLAAVKLASTAAVEEDVELVDDHDSDTDILTPSELQLYRSLQESAVGARAEQATAYLRAHEQAMMAKDALKPVEDIRLVGLKPAQVLPRVEAKLAELQQQRADDDARWAKREEEDGQAADQLEATLEAWVRAYTEKLEKARAARKAERAKWAAAHQLQRARVDAKIAEMTKLLEKAKADPAALVAEPKPVAEAARDKETADMNTDDGDTSTTTARVTQTVASGTVVRPLAAVPAVQVKDEAQLVRLARAQAVVIQASQQDAHVDLSLQDLALTAEEVRTLVGHAEWDEKYPPSSPQPQVDWPLPKRIIALVGLAVARIEISTAVATSAQAAAAQALAEATEQGKAWQLVTNSRRPKPY